MLDSEPADLEARDSEIHSKSNDRCLLFRDVCEKLGDVMIIGQGSRGPNPDKTAIAAFGAQFAEVEVDVETGRVRVLRIVSAHDSGRIINPTLAESQLEGGIIQGLGYALFEERVLDGRLGIQLNPTMHDYKIPTIGDIPQIDAFFVEGRGRRRESHRREGAGRAADHRHGAGDRQRGGRRARHRGARASAHAVARAQRRQGGTPSFRLSSGFTR